MSYAADLDLARTLADVAEALAVERFRAADLRVETKPDRTPVTDADRAVERAIRERLARERPDDAIFGEEFGEEPGFRSDSSRQWIIDPIDGTANFSRGIPTWSTLIALVEHGHPVVGVVSAPALGKRWWASRGDGAWALDRGGEPRRIGVSGVSELGDAWLAYNNVQGWQQHGRVDALLELSRRVWRTSSPGDMWSYMMLAEGLVDIVAEFDLQPYDLAAIVPVIEEAGGVFTGANGEPGPWHGSSVVATPALHAEVLDIVRAGARLAEPSQAAQSSESVTGVS